MGLPRSTYYDAPPVKTDDAEIVANITAICDEFEAYGYRRVGAELRHRGMVVNSKKVRRLMREHDLQPKRRRRFMASTDSDHDNPIFPDLSRDRIVDGPNQLWVADITYIAIATGFVYLAAILDAWSRRVVGYAISRSIDARVAVAALKAASRRPSAGSGDLRRHLLPQRAHLLRPPDAGSRARRAEPAAARRGRVVRRTRGNRLAREPRSGLDEGAAGLRVSQGRRPAAGRERSGRLPSRRSRPPGRVAPAAPSGRQARARRRRTATRGAAAGLPPRRRRDPAADLDEATRLADQGHFVEAATCCEQHLRRSRSLGDGVLSHGPGARRDRQSRRGRQPTTGRRSISIPITTTRRSTSPS